MLLNYAQKQLAAYTTLEYCDRLSGWQILQQLPRQCRQEST